MGKALPILGIVGAAFATLSALVLFDVAAFIVVPLAITGSIVLLAQRNVVGAIAGLLILGLTVLAALGLAGSVTTKGSGTTDFGISESMGRVWAIAACLAIPLGALAARWDDVDPQWLSWVGIGLAVVSFGLCLANKDSLADQQDLVVLFAGLLALGPIAPMVGLLRSGDVLPADE